jgi:hypothetical protein
MSSPTDGTTPAPASSVNATSLQLCRLALQIDETIDQLEAWHLTDGEADLLGVPILAMAIALRRLEQLVYEVQALDQRPRLERLRAAA